MVDASGGGGLSMKSIPLMFLVAFACAPGAAAAETEIPLDKTVTWDAAADGRPGVYKAGDLTLTFRATGSEAFTLTVSLPGAKDLRLSKSGFGFGRPSAEFSVGRVDP